MRISQLSGSCRRMVEEMRRIKFGWVENLPIRDGEPVFDDTIEIVREIAFGKNTKHRRSDEDFELKTSVVELLEAFSRIRDGTVATLRIQDGLPVKMHLKERL